MQSFSRQFVNDAVRASDISRWSQSREIHKNTQSTAKSGRNLIKYMSVQHVWNFSQLLELFTCRKLVNLSWNFVTETCKQRPVTPKLPGVDYVAKNWALAMMLKALPLVHFWSVLLLKEQMMTSVRKTLKMLVWSAQSWSISSEFSLKITTKSTVFYRLRMLFGEVCPQNSREIGRFFREFVPKNLAKFDFFPRPIRSPEYYGAIHHIWKYHG